MAGGNKRPLIDSFIGAINQSYSYITANWQNEDLLANCTSVYNAIKMPMLIFVTIPRSFWNWGACLLFSHLVWMFASRTSSGLVAGLLSHCIPAEPWMQVCEMVNSSFFFFFFPLVCFPQCSQCDRWSNYSASVLLWFYIMSYINEMWQIELIMILGIWHWENLMRSTQRVIFLVVLDLHQGSKTAFIIHRTF